MSFGMGEPTPSLGGGVSIYVCVEMVEGWGFFVCLPVVSEVGLF